jgi:uncharacterized protein (TIGR02246 family)
VVEVERFYARQSRLIDEGDAAGWAATFTPDGEFHSPSYPEPAVGTDALVAFARRFEETDRASGTRSRHVITNVDVEERDDEATAHAYLQIVTTPTGGESRLVRLTTITDHLVHDSDGGWRVQRRQVTRDDS